MCGDVKKLFWSENAENGNEAQLTVGRTKTTLFLSPHSIYNSLVICILKFIICILPFLGQ